MKERFDYEEKVWGAHEVSLSPRHLGALRLEYCLKDLLGVEGRVLEVGCGAGGMAKALKAYRPDLDVYGCDISRKAIQAARESPGRVAFEIGDALSLPFDTAGFSAVVMFDVLEHLSDPGQALAEAWRILAPGGFFHLFVPCEGELFTIHGLLARAGMRAKERYGGHVQRFTLAEVRKLAEDHGFAVRHERWSSHLVNQLADAAYFVGLGIRGRNTSMSVEGYLESSKSGLQREVIRVLTAGVAVASYYESRAFGWIPGSGLHSLSQKPDMGKPPIEEQSRWLS